ncbi:MAG: cell division protein ZapD [Candidatus Polarisedimenticolaceae bacterium]|nr:cell division protein ZapD [Candidatus Polarisedimenticolaceae bacterium]
MNRLPSTTGMAVSDRIIYEHPLNERARTFLRLEHLFQQTSYFLEQTDTWDSRAAIRCLLDILSIFSRYELKKEILKELERQAANLERVRVQPGINMEMLSQVLEDLENSTHQIYQLNGQIGQSLRENEFLMAIVQRSSIPGGSCAFDLPQYHFWLSQPHETRKTQLRAWFENFQPVYDAIILLLSLIRGSTRPVQEVAMKGFFQKSLDAQSPAQLIQVIVPHDATYFPEVSGNKHRFNIRFLQAAGVSRPSQTTEDVSFFLNTCMI